MGAGCKTEELEVEGANLTRRRFPHDGSVHEISDDLESGANAVVPVLQVLDRFVEIPGGEGRVNRPGSTAGEPNIPHHFCDERSESQKGLLLLVRLGRCALQRDV